MKNANKPNKQSEKQWATLLPVELNLRDYFAARALQGILANPEAWDMNDEQIAEWAYNAADAMLDARAAGGAND